MSAVGDTTTSAALQGATAAAQALLAGAFFVAGYRCRSVFEKLYFTSGISNLIAANYDLLLACNIGTLPYHGREVEWMRYLMYLLTTPIMIYQLALLVDMESGALGLCLMLDAQTIVLGFVATVAPSVTAKWLLFCIGGSGFVMMVGFFWKTLVENKRRLQANESMHGIREFDYSFAQSVVIVTFISWSAYPAWWMLNELNGLSNVNAATFNLVFEIVCKGFLGVALTVYRFKHGRRGSNLARYRAPLASRASASVSPERSPERSPENSRPPSPVTSIPLRQSAARVAEQVWRTDYATAKLPNTPGSPVLLVANPAVAAAAEASNNNDSSASVRIVMRDNSYEA